ncbi:MAG: apolipoprotein N-acyltransferase [Cyanobacteria bacterium HKST-UBA02]|nr:apolipoprotein N-acyltransferase [Cyanobacteria bacterium HKST-UBA02]
MSRLATATGIAESDRTTELPASSALIAGEAPVRLVALLLGAVFGLSAPGFDQWYLAWFGLVPLLALCISAGEPWQAGVRGWYFFMGYDLVYMHWYLSIRDEILAGAFSSFPLVMKTSFWLMMSAWQALFASIFCCVLKALPLTGGWLPSRSRTDDRFCIPSFVAVPLLWILIDRMCNSPALLGVPWTALEYSQYKQLAILQSASIFGGAGIAACVILANLAILGLIGYGSPSLRAVSYRSVSSMWLNTTLAVVFLASVFCFGDWRLRSESASLPAKKMVTVSAVQSGVYPGNTNVDYGAQYRSHERLSAASAPGSVCVWPEWSFPVVFSIARKFVQDTARVPAGRDQSWIIGCVDRDGESREFNSVCAMDRKKGLVPVPYHKRYLVPFGEFTPDWVRHTPLGLLLYGPEGKFENSVADRATVVFPMSDVTVGPLLCFECLMPGLSVDNVRAGAQLLVDSSYTGWFEKSVLGDQMVAQCAMRAAENHRSFVFATTLGPSAIIDSSGRILRRSPREEPCLIEAEVPLESDITPFTRFSF